MAYMYCNHSGCNETVKVPAQYCTKHQPKKAKDLTLKIDTSNAVREVLEDKGLLDLIEPLKDTTHLDLLDKANKSMNTKKTTK